MKAIPGPAFAVLGRLGVRRGAYRSDARGHLIKRIANG